MLTAPPVERVTEATTDACLHDFVTSHAQQDPAAIALAAPGRPPLSYGRLRAHIEDVVAALNGLGIGRGDRVALVLPAGPELATACLAVMAGAACAPLNPALRASELDFFLGDLKAKLVITQAGMDSPARHVARTRRIPCAELCSMPGVPAGLFTLDPPWPPGPARGIWAQPEDVALVLHTSGTTSRPKLVPLVQRDLCASMRSMASVLALTPDDRCLNIMPLFHLHALSLLFTSLVAGASIAIPPGFAPSQFFHWLEELRPTWYSAAPTLHQAILEQAPAHRDLIARCPLRFIRSISSALPPMVLSEMEQVFSVPVIEAYGLTEAPSQVTSNPLPPGERKIGSVGPTTGPELAVMDAGGSLLPPGQLGEVVIRGPHVLRGYENNPEANAAAFRDGWFRTGDLGYLDDEGYLFIRGRLKELINRGGEKVSPLEVEGALHEHPAVAQAIAFAVPHPRLGEDVAAAVVLRKGASATESEIRAFVAARLASFKVPSRVLIRDELPRGQTGKLQRIEAADKLGLTGPHRARLTEGRRDAPPRTALEKSLVELWSEVLKVPRVGIHDNFFELGGDSLAAASLFDLTEKRLGIHLPRTALFEGPTVAEVARMLEHQPATESESMLMALQPHGEAPPFFCVHGIGGEIHSFGALAQCLAPEQPFFGFAMPSVNGAPKLFAQIEPMAAHYLAEMRKMQPAGPYYLGGHSLGAIVAYEMAQQLCASGQEVALLMVFDQPPGPMGRPTLSRWSPAYWFEFLANFPRWMRESISELGPGGLLRKLRQRAWAGGRRLSGLLSGIYPPAASDMVEAVFGSSKITGHFRAVIEANYGALMAYTLKPYPGQITVLRARTRPLFHLHGYDLGWGRYARGGVEVVPVPGNHDSILRRPHVQVVAQRIKDLVRKAQVARGRGWSSS